MLDTETKTQPVPLLDLKAQYATLRDSQGVGTIVNDDFATALADLRAIVTTRNLRSAVQQGRHSALLADLPILKALMTTEHAATIQDGSKELWSLEGADLLVLADRRGRIVAINTRSGDFGREAAQEALTKSLNHEEERAWWLVNGRLYEVALQPVESGPHGASRGLGYLVVGDEVDDTVVRELSQVASSQAAFRYGNNIIRSSLSSLHEAELSHQLSEQRTSGRDPEEVQLGQEHYLQAVLDLSPGVQPGVQLIVLKSLDEATAFLGQLNRLLLSLAMVALAVASFMVFLFSHTFTRPLGNLVEAVRALGRSDYDYPVAVQGQDEVAEVTAAFLRMRTSLRESQRKLIESERLATIGRMANSISHDLRHSLAAILANAEFLTENNRTPSDRSELYQEVRWAVNEMTELIDSLLEFSRTREALHPTNGDLEGLFAQFGDVQSAQVIMDRDTGRSKGFGFVEMGSDSEAQRAIQALNGKEADGRALTVNEARPREDRGGLTRESASSRGTLAPRPLRHARA